MTTRVISALLDAMEPPDAASGRGDDRGAAAAGPESVTDEVLASLLNAARVAPSANNYQTWRFVTIRDNDDKRALGQMLTDARGENTGAAFAGSDVVIILCGVPKLISRARKQQPFVFFDVPIALTHVLLGAAELALAHCWTLQVPEQGIRERFGIPKDVRVIAVVGLGKA